MHEYHLVESAVKEAVDRAKKEGATRIVAMTLAVGEFLEFDEASIRLCFEGACDDPLCSGTALSINKLAAMWRCGGCGFVFCRYGSLPECPVCNSHDLLVESGKEFYIENIEIETP